LAQRLSEAAKVASRWTSKNLPVWDASNEDDEEWTRWQEIFEQVEESEKYLEALQVQLREAVASENYEDAAALKGAIDACHKEDPVRQIMEDLKLATVEERFEEAALLRDEGGAGLCGWWLGQDSVQSEDGTVTETDSFGHIVHISPERGRFVGREFTARTLAELQDIEEEDMAKQEVWSILGLPVLELFVTKNDEDEENEGPRYALQPMVVSHPLPSMSASSWGLVDSGLRGNGFDNNEDNDDNDAEKNSSTEDDDMITERSRNEDLDSASSDSPASSSALTTESLSEEWARHQAEQERILAKLDEKVFEAERALREQLQAFQDSGMSRNHIVNGIGEAFGPSGSLEPPFLGKRDDLGQDVTDGDNVGIYLHQEGEEMEPVIRTTAALTVQGRHEFVFEHAGDLKFLEDKMFGELCAEDGDKGEEAEGKAVAEGGEAGEGMQ